MSYVFLYKSHAIVFKTEVIEFTNLFADTRGVDVLFHSEREPGHTIILREENGKAFALPQDTLCSISREELLVLRKTSTDLLNKRWVWSSGPTAAAPVLFVKEPNDCLCFCVDFQELNTKTIHDR